MGQDIAPSCFKAKNPPQKAGLDRVTLEQTTDSKKDLLFSSKEFKPQHLPDLTLKTCSLQTKASHQNDEHTVADDKESTHQHAQGIFESQKQGFYVPLNRNIKIPEGQITFDSFKITHKLGRGTWGQVFSGQLIDRGNGCQRYAIKQMKKKKLFQKSLVNQVLMEKRVMQKINSKFITSLDYTFEDDQYVYIAMEEAQGGDVYSLTDPELQREAIFRQMGQQPIRFILACVVLGLEALHRKRVCYNDLKPENLLVFENGYVKLSDFGLSKHLKPNEKSYAIVGTPAYFSPEMVFKDGCTTTVDLWALGILAYELSNGDCPFDVKDISIPNKFAGLVLNSEMCRTWHKSDISTQLKSFINSLLKFDPKARLGAKKIEDIKNHEFFKCVNFDWQELSNSKMRSPLLQIINKERIPQEPITNSEVRPLFSMFDTREEFRIEGWSKEAPSFD